MKKIKLIFSSFIAFSIFGFFACTSSEENANEEDIDSTEVVITNDDKESVNSDENVNTQAELGIEYTAKYICPNHCKDSGSDKEGECSNCEMEFMENPNYEAK